MRLIVHIYRYHHSPHRMSLLQRTFYTFASSTCLYLICTSHTHWSKSFLAPSSTWTYLSICHQPLPLLDDNLAKVAHWLWTNPVNLDICFLFSKNCFHYWFLIKITVEIFVLSFIHCYKTYLKRCRHGNLSPAICFNHVWDGTGQLQGFPLFAVHFRSMQPLSLMSRLTYQSKCTLLLQCTRNQMEKSPSWKGP